MEHQPPLALSSEQLEHIAQTIMAHASSAGPVEYHVYSVADNDGPPEPPLTERSCDLPGCGFTIPYCQAMQVYKHNGKVRQTLGRREDGRLRLGPVVNDRDRCLVTYHYSQQHENNSHRFCKCGKSAGYVCAMHVSALEEPPTDHQCTRCAAKSSSTEADRARARLGDTRFSRGQASRISNLQQHITGEAHCGLIHYVCHVCPDTRTGGFVTKSDYSNHVKSKEHKENSANIRVVEEVLGAALTDYGESLGTSANGSPTIGSMPYRAASAASSAGSTASLSSEWDNSSSSTDFEASASPIFSNYAPHAYTGPWLTAIPYDIVLYQTNGVMVTNPFDEINLPMAGSLTHSEMASMPQPSTVSTNSIGELLNENDRWNFS